MERRPVSGWIGALAMALLVFASPVDAKKGKSGSTEPGSYIDWKNEVDQLEIVRGFDASEYERVVVGEFDTADTPLPEEDDNTFEPTREVLEDPVSSFVAGLRKDLSMEVAVGEAGDGDLLIVGSVEEMDPGSRAARYWAGFGAGAARTRLALEVKDGKTGEVLLRIRQERRSGVGMGGGNYVKLMERNLRAIGRDIALVLAAF